MIQTFSSNGLHEPLAPSIQVRAAWYDPLECKSLVTIHLVELRDELAVVVPHRHRRWRRLFAENHSRIACLLHHPHLVRLCRHPRHVQTPGRRVDKEQYEDLDEPTQREDLRTEEIARPQRLRVASDELVPGLLATHRAGLQSLGSWESKLRRSCRANL